MQIHKLSVIVLGAALSASACAGPGAYVWAKDLPSARDSSGEYLISTGDVIGVRVVNQDGMSTRARVRSDGRIALPLLGDVEVRGKRPSSLRQELEARFKEYIVAPSVTVNVDEIAPVSVSVLGEVAHPGVVQMDAGCGVAQAIAGAGGLTDYASRDRIFVVRNDEKPVRVRFTFDGIAGSDAAAVRFALKRGDVVVVE
jgi:polysaccharide export outer membrane protein